MSDLPQCPKCDSAYTYEDGELFICPECAHEWAKGSIKNEEKSEQNTIRDSCGNVLADGDMITVDQRS